METQQKILLSLKEQAALLSISWRHLEELTKKRLIPCVRLGRRRLYRPSQVVEALEKLTVKTV
jgi:excisionase family DNA binding protein